MNNTQRQLWDRWGATFIERTMAFPLDHVFKVKDVFPNEWDNDINGGDRNQLGGAIKVALRSVDLNGRLMHIEPLGVRENGNNNQRYRRR